MLIAEDNEVNQQVVKAMLNDAYSVEFATNGQDAIEAIVACQDNNPFDLILMDCQMPVIDGYKATRLIRAGFNGINQIDIPIIALTASAMPEDKRNCFDAGMNDYLTKPLDQKILNRRLQFWLKPVIGADNQTG